jgi:hypothetical protein
MTIGRPNNPLKVTAEEKENLTACMRGWQWQA